MITKVKLAFFRGLLAVIPAVGTIYFLWWAIIKMESLSHEIFHQVLPANLYFPGLGTLLVLSAIVLLGFLVSSFLLGKVFSLVDQAMERFPLIKTVYRPLKDVMSLFTAEKKSQLRKVVLVQYPDQNRRILGIVTRENFKNLRQTAIPEGYLAVWIPHSYMIGGPTLIVRKEFTEELNISPDQAMRLAVTGWVSAE